MGSVQQEHWQRAGDTTCSWLLLLSIEAQCLEDFHVYCTLFSVDVGVTHKHSQTAGDKDQS